MSEPTTSTILAEIEAIAYFAEKMRGVETPECRFCRPGALCWFHTSFHAQQPRHLSEV